MDKLKKFIHIIEKNKIPLMVIKILFDVVLLTEHIIKGGNNLDHVIEFIFMTILTTTMFLLNTNAITAMFCSIFSIFETQVLVTKITPHLFEVSRFSLFEILAIIIVLYFVFLFVFKLLMFIICCYDKSNNIYKTFNTKIKILYFVLATIVACIYVLDIISIFESNLLLEKCNELTLNLVTCLEVILLFSVLISVITVKNRVTKFIIGTIGFACANCLPLIIQYFVCYINYIFCVVNKSKMSNAFDQVINGKTFNVTLLNDNCYIRIFLSILFAILFIIQIVCIIKLYFYHRNKENKKQFK